MQNSPVRAWLSLCLIAVSFLIAAPAAASSFVTATKDCSPPPCTVTEATFSIATSQVVAWSANYLGSGGEGNDFWLTTGPPNTTEINLSSSLVSGANVGTQFLNPGTYRISIQAAVMGSGSYTIEFDRTASIAISASGSHTFAPIIAGGATSAPFSFTISSTGDLPVTLSVGAPSDAHFQISTNPNGQVVPPNRTLAVRYAPGPTAGLFNGTIQITGTSVPPGTPVAPLTVSLSGETLEPVPNIACAGGSCGGAVSLGSADGDVGEVRDFNVTFQNTGTAPLNITSINLVNDTGATFALNGVPLITPIAVGGTRTVSVRFTPPPGEAVFCGHLVIQSNDPDSATKNCFFRATAHHPVPRMVLASTTLDYGDVELGFSFHKAVIVTNEGDAPLIVNLTDICTPDPLCVPDLPQWSVYTTGGPFTIAPGDSRDFEQTYRPTALATHTIRVRVTGNDLLNPQQDVTMTGEGIAPIPIDSVLVLDRSGSMNDSAGPRRKIDALQTAADLFVHLLRPDTGAGTGDKIGMVKYNETNQDYLGLGFINAAQIAAAENRLSNAAIADVARLAPDGATGIGGGMERGANMLLPPSADRKHVMVLLTDGKENRDPRIADVLGDINTNDPGLKIYSIGVGSDIEPAKLQQITNVTGGYFQADDDLSGVSRFELETFYFKIFSNAAAMSIVVDPTTAVNVNGTTPVNVASAWIVSSDRTATFLALDDPAMRSFYTMEFVDPQGHVIDTGSAVAGIPIHIVRRMNYSLFRVIFPDPSMSPQYVGQWTLRVRPTGKWNVKDIREYRRKWANTQWDFISPNVGLVPIAFAAAVGSDYRMDVSAVPTTYQPGADVTLKASFTDRNFPSKGKNVTVDARRPNGMETLNLQLYDDGTHGDADAGDGTWTGHYTNTPEPGYYRFRFHGLGKNERGELAPREETRYVSLTPPVPPGGGDGRPCSRCIPCDPRKTKDCQCFVCKEPEPPKQVK